MVTDWTILFKTHKFFFKSFQALDWYAWKPTVWNWFIGLLENLMCIKLYYLENAQWSEMKSLDSYIFYKAMKFPSQTFPSLNTNHCMNYQWKQKLLISCYLQLINKSDWQYNEQLNHHMIYDTKIIPFY